MIKDLGKDFGAKRGVILGCCCTCCCLHTLAAAAVVGKGLLDELETTEERKLGFLPWFGLILGFLGGLVLIALPTYYSRMHLTFDRLMTGLLWSVALGGPAAFPLLIGSSWSGGVLLAFFGPNSSEQIALLNKRFGRLLDWVLTSWAWAMLALLAMMGLARFAG